MRQFCNHNLATKHAVLGMDKANIFKGKVLRILIVDDVEENIILLKRLLGDKGLTIYSAASGRQAFDVIRANCPDLILLDISMPTMDGYEVCEILKNNPGTRNIPIIFISGKAEEAAVLKGLEKGAVDYITKPFKSGELTQRIFTHLELKITRDLLADQNQELIRLNEVKTRLFSVISHEMKNLFNNILFGTESLEKEIEFFEKDEIAHMAGLVNDSARRAYDLLQNLLDWSRSQMKAIEANPTEVEVLMAVNQAVSLLRPAATKKKLFFEVFPQGEDFRAFADMEMLNAVLRNLLSNAIKYSHPENEIAVEVSETPDFVQVRVKDMGVGMSADRQEEILSGTKPFRSMPGTHKEKGSGLGLMLVKDFVAKNKGVFGLQSEEAKGSIFWFSLPKPGKNIQ